MKNNPIFFRENYTFHDSIELYSEEVEHLRSIRLDKEEKIIEFRDGKGNSHLYQFEFKKWKGERIQSIENVVQNYDFSLATALPKSQKLDLILQKGTELGVSCFHLVTFMQSDRKEINEGRCQKIIKASASQSRRHTLPEILIYNNLKDFLEKNPGSFYLHPYSNESISQLNDFNLIPVIGPEGGFREEEIKLFTEFECNGYNLGRNILRIETATIYISSVIHYERLRKKND